VNSRPRSYHRYSPIHRATASRALKDGFAVHAILPRPEGRGLPRYQIKPIVERVYPFGEAAEALRHLIEDRPFGKVVLAA
jgi:Zinc-binding dehydrogenase